MIQSPEFPPHSRMGLGRAYSAGLKDGVVAKAGRSFTSSLQYCEVVLMRGVMPCCVFKNRPPNITLPLSCEWLMVRFVCVCVCWRSRTDWYALPLAALLCTFVAFIQRPHQPHSSHTQCYTQSVLPPSLLD